MNFIAQIVGDALWGSSDMVLADVGASGGIDRRWQAFGERLAAVGFDPLAAEVARLSTVEARSKVRYEAAMVGCRTYDDLFPPALRRDSIATMYNQPFHRSSAVAAHGIQQKNYVRDVFNAGADVTYSDRFVTLDEYFASSSYGPNFLKIDTDGSDFQVLLGAAEVLDRPDLLGVEIEAQFHGAVHDYANTFSNIDKYLRERGFSLFELDSYRYSRAALPAPFAIGLPAQTVSGQVHWGEAVYFRDLGHPLYDRTFNVSPTRETALKLCCLFALYGLDDCAADLLTVLPCLQELEQRERLLDALTPSIFGDRTYREYMGRFHQDPSAWLPQNLAALSSAASTSQKTRETPPPPPADSEPAAAALPCEPTPETVASSAAATEPPTPPAGNLVEENLRLQEKVQQFRRRVGRLKEAQVKMRDRIHRLDDKIRRLREQQTTSQQG